MKKICRLLSIFLTVLMLAGLCIAPFEAFAANGEGLTFTAKDLYRPEKTYDAAPNTFEAWIKLPKNAANNRNGVILGNYNHGYTVINFEIHSSGRPRLYWVNENGKLSDWIFTDVNVCTSEWLHLAIVRSVSEKKVHCYVNGVLKQSLDITDDIGLTEFIPKGGLSLGGDVRGGNAQYFKGAIKEAAVFSGVRTADEIAADMNGITDKSGLLAHYDLADQAPGTAIKDASGNGCDLKYVNNETWIDAKKMPALSDYAYSFAVVGDTQKLNYNYPDKFSVIYDYILDNIESEKIEFVLGLGDITDKSDKGEWDRAKAAFKSLDGKVRYSIVRGNHDTTSTFNAAFPWSEYENKVDGAFANNMLNTYNLLEIGEVKYLIITLDYGASDKVLNWAGELCDKYPEHNVIITTHAYLFRDKTTLDQTDVCPPATTGGSNNGDHMWDKLVSKHENIVMVISGHDPYDEIVVSQVQGEKGNTVTQMLVDPQTTDTNNGGLGLVAMLYFSEDGKNVDVRYYSTIKKKFYQSINQFSLTLDVVGDDTVETEAVETAANGNYATTEKADVNTNEAPTSAADSGCSSTLSLGVVAIIPVMLGTAFAVARKKED